jgi:hypothetical protein
MVVLLMLKLAKTEDEVEIVVEEKAEDAMIEEVENAMIEEVEEDVLIQEVVLETEAVGEVMIVHQDQDALILIQDQIIQVRQDQDVADDKNHHVNF